MTALNGQGIYLSAYAGMLPDQLSAADTAAVALSSTSPIIFVDTNFTLGMNYSLSSTLVGVGGVLTTGANTLSCPYARGEVPLFDRGGTGTITFTAPAGWIDGILFNPALDGMTDCINDFNRWANSCSLQGAKFRWPAGQFHTTYSNKFKFPINTKAQIDASGAILDSTFVYEGRYQNYVGCPSIGGQVMLTMNGSTGNYTVGEQIQIGSAKGGVVLAWNSTTKVLAVGGFVSFTSARYGVGFTITGVTSGTARSIASIAYQIAAGSETGTAVGDVQWSKYESSWASGCVYGHSIGMTGTNTNGSSAPSFAYQLALSQQNNIFNTWVGSGNENYGICIDCSRGTASFANANTFNELNSSFNGKQAMIVANGSVENTFLNVDFENNQGGAGSTLVTMNSGDNVFVGGLLDATGNASAINYTFTDTELEVLGTRMTVGVTPNLVLTITGITQANPAVLSYTCDPTLTPVNGDMFGLNNITGMTNPPFTMNDQLVVVTGLTGGLGSGTFQLVDIHGNNFDTTGYSAWSSGGFARKGSEFVGIFRQSGFDGFNNLPTMDSITTTDIAVTGALSAEGHTFLKATGLTDYPTASVMFTAAGAPHTTGHTLWIDTTNLGSSNLGPLHVSATVYDSLVTPANLGGFALTIHYYRSSSGTLSVAVPSLTGVGAGTVTVTSVVADPLNPDHVLITFNSSAAILHCVPFVNYGDRLGVDLG